MTSSRLRVAVLSGGPSREHGISVGSGVAVAKALVAAGHDVLPVHIAPDGHWALPRSGPTSAQALPGGEASPAQTLQRLAAPDGGAIDLVFIALHGAYGEDGTVQGLLETAGVAYTGSGVLSSALAMDKERTKEVLAHHGIPTPAWAGISGWDWDQDPASALARASAIGVPAVVKPAAEGSSFGISLVREPEHLAEAIRTALDGPRRRALVERLIDGTEVSCPVLGNHDGPLRALPIVEIVPRGEYFDFAAKYEGESDEICPARITESVASTVSDAALLAHRVLGCDGLSRSDFILDADGTPWFLETNTVPGMTDQSLCPLSARGAGLSFADLCHAIAELALAPRRDGS